MTTNGPGDPAVIFRERITDEILFTMGVPRNGWARKVFGPLLRLPAGRFGRIAARIEDEAPRTGVSGAARRVLPDFSLQVTAAGAENIPREGPLLVVSNHPGAYDSLAIASCIPRTDLNIAVSDVPFTRALKEAGKHFFYVPGEVSGRMAALRASLAHLANGGALLIFAHGEVEPDPDLLPGAHQSITEWSQSVEVMLRKVPQTWLQVVIASGVLLPRFIFSPLVRLRRKPSHRQKMAEAMQIAWQMVSPKTVQAKARLTFATPIQGKDLPPGKIMQSVIRIGQATLAAHMAARK